MEIKPEIITSLVQSGLIPALLFRVGTGPDLDLRLNILVVHFLYQMLLKISFVQPRFLYYYILLFPVLQLSSIIIYKNYYFLLFYRLSCRYKRQISLISVLPKPVSYQRGVPLPGIPEQDDGVSDTDDEEPTAQITTELRKIKLGKESPGPVNAGASDKSYKNLKLISDTMHAHGVTPMLLQSLGYAC